MGSKDLKKKKVGQKHIKKKKKSRIAHSIFHQLKKKNKKIA